MLQRAQKIDEQVLLSRREKVEFKSDVVSFVAMILNGFVECAGPAVVHQFRPGADSPKRRSAHLVRRLLATVLHYPVPGTDVMQEEVTVGVDDFVTECRRNDERPRVHGRTRGCGNPGRNVASVAADAVEQAGAPRGFGGPGKGCVAWGDL